MISPVTASACSVCGGPIDAAEVYQVENVHMCPGCYCDSIDDEFDEHRPGVKLAAFLVLVAVSVAMVVIATVMAFISS